MSIPHCISPYLHMSGHTLISCLSLLLSLARAWCAERSGARHGSTHGARHARIRLPLLKYRLQFVSTHSPRFFADFFLCLQLFLNIWALSGPHTHTSRKTDKDHTTRDQGATSHFVASTIRSSEGGGGRGQTLKVIYWPCCSTRSQRRRDKTRSRCKAHALYRKLPFCS